MAVAAGPLVRGTLLGDVAGASTNAVRGDAISPVNLELVTLTEDRAVITWYTGYTGSDDGLGRMKPAPSDGTVEWGTHPRRLHRVSGSRHHTPYHYVELTDLEPGQTYYYRARSNGTLVPPTPFTLIEGNAVGRIIRWTLLLLLIAVGVWGYFLLNAFGVFLKIELSQRSD